MIKNSKDKQITDSSQKAETPLEEFHFAGGGEYQPLTVYAKSREEAEQLWVEKRVKVESNQIIN